MRRFISFALVLLLFASFSTSSNPETDYDPILMTRSELAKSIGLLPSRIPLTMDKIYVKGNLLLITEKYKGVHVYDNSNPTSPKNIGFLRIPGCVDVAMKGFVLYADNATDLVAITLADFNKIAVCSRVEDCMPEITPPDLNYIPSAFSKENRPANTVIVEWKKR